VCQTVKGTHTVTDTWKQAACLDESGNTPGEVVYRRVHKGDDQDFLIIIQVSLRNKLGSQKRQCPGFPASRHCSDAHPPTGIRQDSGLAGARPETRNGVLAQSSTSALTVPARS